MSLVEIVHLLGILVLLSIPFWDKKYLAYGLFIPICIKIAQILFGGCLFTIIQNDPGNQYFLKKYFFKNSSREDIINYEGIVLIGITALAGYKLQ